MNDVWVYEAGVYQFGTKTLIKKLHFLSYNFLDAAHRVTQAVFEDGSEFDGKAVEIGYLRRLRDIQNVENPEFILEELSNEEDYDPNLPFEMLKDNPELDSMTFKHNPCGETITCANFDWPYIKCPKCKEIIYRKEIDEIGGMFLWTGKLGENNDE